MGARDTLVAARDEHAAGYAATGQHAPPRAGIVGAGFIGAVHARSARLAGARLAGIATSSPERSREAAGRLGAERAYATAEALVTADDVDVVHICSPNATHAPLATLALEAGKHVICEKPLATASADADALVASAERSGRVATVPFVYRFHPVVREARARVRGGELGPVRLITGGYLQDWLASADDDNWRVDAAQGGPSRAFADIGSHWCDLAEFVTGDRISALCAQTATVFGERADRGHARAFEEGSAAGEGARRSVTTEDAVTAIFRTAGGAHGALAVSQVSPGRKNHLHLEIACAEASVGFEQERPETLWLGRRGASEIITRDPGTLGADGRAVRRGPRRPPAGLPRLFRPLRRGYIRCHAGGGGAGGPPVLRGRRA